MTMKKLTQVMVNRSTDTVRNGDNLLPISIEQEAEQDAEIEDEDF